MSVSEYIAGLIGPVLLAVGIIILLRREFFNTLADGFIDNVAMIFFAGMVILVAGLAIVRAHNLWVADWRVIVTMFGWLAVIGGLFRMALPDQVGNIRALFPRDTAIITVIALIVSALGAFLTVKGYRLMG